MAHVKRVATSTGASHSFSDEEKESFVEHINAVLGGDPALKGYLPINPNDNSLFSVCSDSVVLCKLINNAVPETIDERVINIKPKMSVFQKTENGNLCVNSAKAIGCSVVNIGASDLIEGTPHLVLGLIWQIIRIGLLSQITLTNHPEMFRLLEPGEDIGDLLKLPPDQILLRWFNYHLKNSGSPKRVNNFGKDIADSEAYTLLLNQLAPSKCDKNALREGDVNKRAEMVLNNAEKLDCRKFLKPRDIVAGNPKLNLAFVANLFNTHPGLEPLTDEERGKLDEFLFAGEGTREARAFCLWINSLGIEPLVNNLFEDLRDGLIILRVMDKIVPGSVDWKRVNTKEPLHKIKKVENCNYAVDLGKVDPFKFSLVGVGGSDLVEGNKTLTLALIWQLMRFHVVTILKSLAAGKGGNVTDADIVAWANHKVSGAGRSSKMDSFKDPSLRSGVFFLDLLAACRDSLVDPSLVTPGGSDADAMQNAKYAISLARKMGATIFLLPEDIVEVKPKMILTFVGSLMAVDLAGKK
jgi:plastin-1